MMPRAYPALILPRFPVLFRHLAFSNFRRYCPMCNDYQRQIELGRVLRLMSEIDDAGSPFWANDQIPNDAGPAQHIRIRDRGLIARLSGQKLVAEMLPWSW